jgi:hypothetical protein
VKHADEIRQLAEGGRVSLAAWLGEPMDGAQARQMLDRLQQRRRRGPAGADSRFSLDLAELVCRYWTGHDIECGYRTLAALAELQREHALLELCCGQLLIARRCLTAWRHLDRGFQLAAHLLEAEDYFRVLRRHEVLRQLPLSSTPADPASLDALLKEAQVIARIKGSGRPAMPGAGKHQDTLD